MATSWRRAGGPLAAIFMLSVVLTILQASGTLNFGAGGPLTMRCTLLVQAAGAFEKGFLLGLVSATPA